MGDRETPYYFVPRIKNEFKWFDLDGNFVTSVYLPGAFMSRPVIQGKALYLKG